MQSQIIWDTAAAPVLLPQRLTALDVLMLSDYSDAVVEVPLPGLAGLAALRRLVLRFELGGCVPPGGNAALPALPAGLTHLTIGVRQGRSGAVGWDPYLLGQARTACGGPGIYLCSLCRCAAIAYAGMG